MFGIKKKQREIAEKSQLVISQLAQPLIRKFRKKILFPIAFWGKRNPKMLMSAFISITAILLGCNVISLYFHSPETTLDKDMNNTASDISLSLHTKQHITDNREAIINLNHQYIEMQRDLALEVDSLLALKNKTKEDSIAIVMKYNLLNPSHSNSHEYKTN